MTLICATAFNRPDFIELQHRLFGRFLEDDYEFCVVSDADTVERRTAIGETCDRLGIRWYQVPQEIHDRPYLHRSPGDNYNNPNVRHCNSVQWAWDSFFSHHDGPVMVIDSDMFLIRPFSIEKALEHQHLSGVHWGTQDTVTGEGKSYLWLALILLNNPRLPERETICFNCGVLPGTSAVCDSGGWTHVYLNKHREVLKVGELKYQQGHEFFCPYRYAPAALQNFDDLSAEEIARRLVARGFRPAEVDLALESPYTIELLGENHFLHYRAGTNYENYSDEELAPKDRVLLEFFDRIVSE